MLEAVGSADDPASGGRQMPSHWGHRERHVVTQSSPTGSQCIPAVGCAEASRYIVRRPAPSRVHRPRRRAHLRQPRRRGVQRGRVLGEPEHGVQPAPARAVRRARQRLRDLGAGQRPGSGARSAELVRGFRGLEIHHLDGTDYFAVRDDARSIIEHIRAGVGPALIHADVVRPYSHSAADTQSKYRSVEELAEEARHDPIDAFEAELIRGGVLTDDEAAALRLQAREIVSDAATAALAGARPDPRTVTTQVVALPDISRTRATPRGGR